MNRRYHLKSLLGLSLVVVPSIVKGASVSTFTLSGPSSVDISPGKTVQVVISIIKGKGKPRRVNLILGAIPTGFAVSLAPTSGIPTYNSTLTITASSTLPEGDYSLEIKGQLA